MILRIKWCEAHHLYVGAYMVGLGVDLLAAGDFVTWAGILVGVGLVLIVDDLYQHHRQVRQPEFESILTSLFRAAVDALIAWARRRLGIEITYPQFLIQRRTGHAAVN